MILDETGRSRFTEQVPRSELQFGLDQDLSISLRPLLIHPISKQPRELPAPCPGTARR
jgi:hypothetical protein